MPKIYADLIIKGLKAIEDVPKIIRAQVEKLLLEYNRAGS